MPLGERARLALDAEKLGDEVLDVRRERDQELRLGKSRGGMGARGGKLLGERAVSAGEKSEERRIDLDEAFALVQIRERGAEAKLHEVRIIGEFFPAFTYSPGSSRCRSRTACSSSRAAHRDSVRRLRAWRPRTAPKC